MTTFITFSQGARESLDLPRVFVQKGTMGHMIITRKLDQLLVCHFTT